MYLVIIVKKQKIIKRNLCAGPDFSGGGGGVQGIFLFSNVPDSITWPSPTVDVMNNYWWNYLRQYKYVMLVDANTLYLHNYEDRYIYFWQKYNLHIVKLF